MKVFIIALLLIGSKVYDPYAFTVGNEGTRLKAYHDIVGWAICHGNHFYENGDLVKKGDIVKKGRCPSIVKSHFKKHVKVYTKDIDLRQGRMIAIEDYIYQRGVGTYHRKLKPLLIKWNLKAIEKELERGYPQRKRKEMWNAK